MNLHSLVLHCKSDTVNFCHVKLFIYEGRIITDLECLLMASTSW